MPKADDILISEFLRTLPQQRFFADKAATAHELEVLTSFKIPGGDPFQLEIFFLRLTTDADSAHYLVPVAWSDRPLEGVVEGIDTATIPVLVATDDAIGFDALAHPETITALGRHLATQGELGAMKLRTVPGADTSVIEALDNGRPMGAEQSNTSVIFDDAVMCKFFRRVHAGTNADVELLSALSEHNNENVPELFGWLELELDGEQYTTAMLQQFVPNSADGWAMALTAVRDTIRDFETPLDQLGTDFATESQGLGAAVASVHAGLKDALPDQGTVSGDELVAPMLSRLEHVCGVVPQIAEIREQAATVFEAAAGETTSVPVQRIHGDLHLGQVLRTPREWLLIDFEGEPSRPWDQRRLPDHPLRDIAGMLRSFDYAAHFPLLTGRDNFPDSQSRVAEWAERNIDAFLAGYAEVSGTQLSAEAPLLRAFILDKAIYECLYEAQNRPDWLQLPLTAVQCLLD